MLLEVEHRGRFAIGQLARLLDERSPGEPAARSGLELHLDTLLALTHLPPASREHPLPNDGGYRGFVDRALVDAKLIVEADGRRWHSRLTDMARDRARDRAAGRCGWHTIRILDEEVATDPTGIASEIAAEYEVRKTQLSRAV